MFSKSKRFASSGQSTPAPGSYDVAKAFHKKNAGAIFEKSERFKNPKDLPVTSITKSSSEEQNLNLKSKDKTIQRLERSESSVSLPTNSIEIGLQKVSSYACKKCQKLMEEKTRYEDELLKLQTNYSLIAEDLNRVEEAKDDLMTKYESMVQENLDNIQQMHACDKELKDNVSMLSTKCIDLEQCKGRHEQEIQLHLEQEEKLENENMRLRDEILFLKEEKLKEIERVEKELTDNLKGLTSKYELLEQAYTKQAHERHEKEQCLKTEIEIVKRSYESCKEDVQTMHLTYISLKESYDCLSEDADNLRSEYRQQLEELEGYKKQCVIMAKAKEELEINHCRVLEDLAEKNMELEELKNSTEELISNQVEQSAEELRKRIAILESSEELLNNKVMESKREAQEEKERKIKDELGRRIIDAQAKISTLEQMVERTKTEYMTEKEILEQDIGMWQGKYNELVSKTQPFQSQLDAYEYEKGMLLDASLVKEEELSKLADKYARILGHQNSKQKIKHVMKLKEENVQLKKDLFKLRTKERKDAQKIHYLELKLLRATGNKRYYPSDTFQSNTNKENLPRKVLEDSTLVNCEL